MNGEIAPASAQKSKLPFIITIIVVVLVAVTVYWYLMLREPTVAPAAPVVELPAAESITSPDLGSELFEKSSNPLSGQLPETVAPVPNPLEGIYENPFGE